MSVKMMEWVDDNTVYDYAKQEEVAKNLPPPDTRTSAEQGFTGCAWEWPPKELKCN